MAKLTKAFIEQAADGVYTDPGTPGLCLRVRCNGAYRSWIFRSIGYGHDELFWKDFVSTLRLVGYDYALSIEHEDSLLSKNEGLVKAVDVLKRAIPFEEKMSSMRWI